MVGGSPGGSLRPFWGAASCRAHSPSEAALCSASPALSGAGSSDPPGAVALVLLGQPATGSLRDGLCPTCCPGRGPVARTERGGGSRAGVCGMQSCVQRARLLSRRV